MEYLNDCDCDSYITHHLELFIDKVKDKYGLFDYTIPTKNNIKTQSINKIHMSVENTDINWTSITYNPIDFISKCSKNKMEYIIKQANHYYYNNIPKITDEIYDIIIDYVTNKYPELDILYKVGSNVTKYKVKLPIYMPSMEKIKPDTKTLNNWLTKYNQNKVISDKLDGMSLLIDTRKKPYKAYTRGNGFIGQDITWILDYINIGSMINGIARGELIVSKENWIIIKNKYPQYSNARNFVSGYTGRKQVDKQMMKWIDFVAYEWIIDIPLKQEKQLDILTKFNINVVYYEIYESINNHILSSLLQKRRSIGKYEIDGMIITDNDKHPRSHEKYPKYSKAFKMVIDDHVAEVHVLGVKWIPSMYGVLNPIINVSSVVLDGVTISNATGNNARFIVNNKIGGLIGPGSIVKLTRSGGVIPKILKVVKPFQGCMENCLPKSENYVGGYSWNNTNVDIVLNNPELNKIVKLKRIEYFFSQLGVSYFKSGMIKKVYDMEFDTIPKMLNMSRLDLLNIEGIKETLANKIIESIHTQYNGSNLVDIMACSYMFGSGYGKKRIKPIILKVPNLLELDLSNKEIYNDTYNKIISIPGYQHKIAIKFLKNIDSFKTFYVKLPPKNINIEEGDIQMKVKTDKYKNKIFCSSGFRPDDRLKKHILNNNGTIETTFTNKVTDLVIKKNSKKTSKIQKAIQKKIRIIYLEDIYN